MLESSRGEEINNLLKLTLHTSIQPNQTNSIQLSLPLHPLPIPTHKHYTTKHHHTFGGKNLSLLFFSSFSSTQQCSLQKMGLRETQDFKQSPKPSQLSLTSPKRVSNSLSLSSLFVFPIILFHHSYAVSVVCSLFNSLTWPLFSFRTFVEQISYYSFF